MIDRIEANSPPGFTSRAVDPDADAQAVLELCEAAAIAEDGVSDITLQAVKESYAAPGFDPDTDARLVFDSAHDLVGVVEFYDNDDDHVAPYVYARVRPDQLRTGVGQALLDWARRRGERSLERATPELRVALHSSVPGTNRDMQEIFERSGWHQERVFWEMEIVLDREPSVPELPHGISIRTAEPETDDRAVYLAVEEAFSDHYGFVHKPFEMWAQMTIKLNPYDPTLWFLAMDGAEIAGMSLCLPEQRGRDDSGYVHTLGVRRPWRGRGLGLALLRHSFAELYRKGKHRVALHVDAQSLTGATRLYERAGMIVARESRAYELVLRDGREIRTV